MARRRSLQQQQPRISSQQTADQAMSDGDSLKRGSGSQAALSLLFSLESGDVAEKLSSSVPDGLNEYDPVTEVQRIKATAAALSEAECKLARAVAEAKASSILTTGSVQLGHVGSYLRSRHGYLVAIRHANVVKRPRAYLRMLYHKYLVVRALEGLEGVDVLVDLSFRDHFVLPHSTGWYAKLLAALPHDWVGTAAALAPLVGLMSAGMRLCFKQAGVPLPPWREGRAVLSRWLPEAYEEEAPPLVPLPDGALRRMLAPYHGTPFRSALQRAAAGELQWTTAGDVVNAHAMAVCDQQLLPSSSRPPLPRPSSAVALVTASVKAAAAGAAAGAQQAGAGASHGHQAHAPVVPDVPRKIIVGFPDQNGPPTAATKHSANAAAAAILTDFRYGLDIHGAADAGVVVIRQQHQADSNQQQAPAASTAKLHLQQQQPQQQRSICQPTITGSAVGAVTVQQQQGPGAEATVRKGRPAGGLVALQQPEAVAAGCVSSTVLLEQHTRSNSLAAPSPAATSVQQQQPLPQQQKQLVQGLLRPAFSSTVGVVTATCSSISPAVVVRQEFLQQQQQQQQNMPHLIEQQQQHEQSSCVRQGCNHPATAGAAVDGSNIGLRQFKTLDQLLPRIRTIRLGVA